MIHQRLQIAIDKLGDIPKHVLLDETAVIDGLGELRIVGEIQVAHIGVVHEPVKRLIAKTVLLAQLIAKQTR